MKADSEASLIKMGELKKPLKRDTMILSNIASVCYFGLAVLQA